MSPFTNTRSLIVLAAFCIITFILVVSIAVPRMNATAEVQMKINLIVTMIGTLIALLAALLLLLRAAGGAGIGEMLPLTLPVLAGVFIASAHWAPAVALGALGVTWLVKEMFSHRQDKRSRGRRSNPPLT